MITKNILIFLIFSQIAAKAEHEDNELEQKRNQGKKVVYGQVIQVTDVKFVKFIDLGTVRFPHGCGSDIPCLYDGLFYSQKISWSTCVSRLISNILVALLTVQTR